MRLGAGSLHPPPATKSPSLPVLALLCMHWYRNQINLHALYLLRHVALCIL